jgi:putative heme-binding domain-containing protein
LKTLAELLRSPSAVARLTASQELLRRPAGNIVESTVLSVALDKNAPLESRVAALFTYAQAAGAGSTAMLLKFVQEDALREFTLRALADRKTQLQNIPIEPFLSGLNDPSLRVRAAAIVGLNRLGKASAIPALMRTKVPSSFVAPTKAVAEGPHATPNSPIILPHLAVRALVNLNAVDACVAQIGKTNSTIALWALRYMHDIKAVNGLINAYKQNSDKKLKADILTTLSRLYKQEAPYDASWWWGTRPDMHGPYYKAITWAGSPAIKTFLKAEFAKADADGKQFITDLNERHMMAIPEFGIEEKAVAGNDPKIDLEKIKNQTGQVGKASIEDIILAIGKIPGDPVAGKALFTGQGCIACHALSKTEKPKGPFMGQIGSIMTRQQIAESILKPNASISQGFASVMITAKGDKTYMGFVTEQTADRVVLRNIAGEVFTINAADILSRKEIETSMMPAGLANSLSYQELASLVTFLSQQK